MYTVSKDLSFFWSFNPSCKVRRPNHVKLIIPSWVRVTVCHMCMPDRKTGVLVEVFLVLMFFVCKFAQFWGLLWLMRALRLLEKTLHVVLEDAEQPLHKCIQMGYEGSLKPHHNFLTRNVIQAAIMAAPSRAIFLSKLCPDPGNPKEKIQEFLKFYSPVLQKAHTYLLTCRLETWKEWKRSGVELSCEHELAKNEKHNHQETMAEKDSKKRITETFSVSHFSSFAWMVRSVFQYSQKLSLFSCYTSIAAGFFGVKTVHSSAASNTRSWPPKSLNGVSISFSIWMVCRFVLKKQVRQWP